MNCRFFAVLFVSAIVLDLRAAYTPFFATGDISIPDYDSTGYQDTRTIAGLGGTITDVNVTLDIVGGFNGDLYAWLSHDSGLSILLNRVGRASVSDVGYRHGGFGASSPESPFVLDDQATSDVHFYGTEGFSLNNAGQLTGTWQPDGRILDPESAAGLFDAAGRSHRLGIFNGMDPNGQWTLFVADLSTGDTSTLIGWGLHIEVVPEPTTFTLLGLGSLALVLARMRR